ncbi:MAG: hypothetical protein IPM84_09275 [Anaerolineae bacterium]|nr:hypothetical protein [Anaerolineae bacterium]
MAQAGRPLLKRYRLESVSWRGIERSQCYEKPTSACTADGIACGGYSFLARPAPGHAAGTGGIIGAVFFDADADGIRDATDNGLDAGLTVEIRDAATNGQVFLTVTTTALDGTYAFTALDANTYLVTELSLEALGYTRTTPNTRTVVVGSVVALGVDFGGTLLMTLSGTIFDDANQDGVRGLGETVIPDALVEVFHDPNGNGLIDSGEPLAAPRSPTPRATTSLPTCGPART